MNLATEFPVIDHAPWSVDVVRGGIETLDALAKEWGALCDYSPSAEPFYRPEWFRAYVAAFAPGCSLIVVTARQAGKLVAVLPLIKEIGSLGGLPARKLRSAGNTHTCRYELMHHEAAPGTVAEVVWQALLQEGGWDVLEIENAPAGGALERLVQHAGKEGYRTSVAPALTPPYLDLTACGGSFEAFLETLDAKFRSNLRRRMRKLQSRGAVTFSKSAAADDPLGRFYALERAGWKGEARSAIACDGSTRTFYDAVAHLAERRGTLLFYALELDGNAVAMFFGLYDRGRYYLLKTAYDESLRDCSPGQLLTSEALRELIGGGGVEFDFLGGTMEWKRDWTPTHRRLVDLHVFRGAAGHALYGVRCGLRPALVRLVRRIKATR